MNPETLKSGVICIGPAGVANSLVAVKPKYRDITQTSHAARVA